MWGFHSITVEAEVPITVEDFYNEVGNSRFPEIVTLTDVPTDWIALNGAIKKYPEKSTLFLTMSGAFSDIPPNAFEDCDALFTFYAPNMTGSIGKSAFENCNTLINFYAPKMMGDIGENAFKGCNTLRVFSSPEMTGSIGANAFSGCHDLEYFNAPCATGGIGKSAFKDCFELSVFHSLYITDSIGDEAFSGCRNLEYFTATKMAGGIGEDVFKGCAILIKITFGEAGTADGSIIKEGAFNGFDNIGSCDLVFTGKPKGGTVDEAASEWTIGSTLYKFKSIKVHTE